MTSLAPWPGRFAERDEVWASDFGAKCNGDDETAIFQEAIHYCKQYGRTLHIPDGRIGISKSLADGEALDELIVGAGPTATIFETNLPTEPLLNPAGSLTGKIALFTAPTTVGATSIVLDSTAEIKAGDILLLRDPSVGVEGEDIEGGSGKKTVAVAGEQARVRSVDSATKLSLDTRLNWSYSIGSDVRINNWIHASYSSFGVLNTVPLTGTAAARGILATCIRNFKCQSLSFEHLDGPSIYTNFAAGWRVLDCDFTDLREEVSNAYAMVSGRGSTHGLMQACQGQHGRHLFTTAASTEDICAQHWVVTDCIAEDYRFAAFDSHPGSRFGDFIDCKAHGCWLDAFQLRGPDQRVINPIVDGARRGVYAVFGADRFLVSGGEMENIEEGVVNHDCDDGKITDDLTIRSPALNGVRVLTPDKDWEGHMKSMDLANFEVTGNPSGAGLNFESKAWSSGFRIGSAVRVPSATTPVKGAILPPLVKAEATVAVPL